MGSRVGVAQAAVLASVAALQGFVHEDTRSDTKASFAVAQGPRQSAKWGTDTEATEAALLLWSQS